MNIGRNLLAGALIGIVGLGVMASSASAAKPMKVKIAPFAGKKVRVAKNLKVIVSCSKDCVVKVRVKLITPAGNSTVKGGKRLKTNQSWTTGMTLTNYGRRILKNHYRRSRLRVSVRARNTKNGTVRKKTRTFGFRR